MTDTARPTSRPVPRSRPAAWIAGATSSRATADDRAATRRRRPTTAEDIAAARALQRKLFDAGYAGISFPAEYGGRGLTAAHERAFREEAAGYVTPDLGVAGGVTFGPIGRSLLAHASPEFLAAAHPEDPLAARRSGASSTPSPRPARTSPASAPGPTRDGDHWILNGSKIWSTRRLLRRLGDVPGPHRLGRAQAPRASPGSPCRPTPTGVTVRQITPDQRQRRVLRGVPRRRRRHRRRRHRRGQPRLDRHPDDARLRAGCRRVERDGARAARAGARPRRRWPGAVGRIDDPVARQAIARAHINDYAQFHLGRRIAARLRGVGRRPTPAVAAYSKLAVGHVHADPRPARARDRRQRGAGVGAGRRAAASGRPSTTSTAARSPSPPAPTRCSATASASACSACRASRASTRRSRSTRCSATRASGAARSADPSQRVAERSRSRRSRSSSAGPAYWLIQRS